MSATHTTPAQAKVLRFVQRHIKRWDCAPTRSEIGAALGISRPTAEQHPQALRDQRLVTLHKQWRGIFLRGAAR